MASSPFLSKLMARVSPPPEPTFGTSSWQQVFAELGTALPADYVEFIDTYGSCEFGGYLAIADPRSYGTTLTYHQVWCDHGDQYRESRERFPDLLPLAAWPEPGGFLGWGSDIDGNWFGWLTEGEPDRWPTAVWGRQMKDGLVGPVPMTEFLFGWLSHPPAFHGLPDLSDENERDDDSPNQISCHSW
ncbi:hypothetical protein DPM19_33460 [Actinomadura craniellae]|uniref:SMI1/KNR4 family protein n=1 Tax=Actinomadura craniellae TaxID=2231787 RepID=A0A365GVP2_9ACTN|nr:SMI1/KNR4 family protein [Actinomadura craniellae]RAY10870.1 hypothetical protein DPM19_33460 [Actinomadura craniellae]